MTEPAGSRAARVVCEDARTVDTSHLVDVERWRRLAESVLRSEGVRGELAVTFVDTVDIAELNAEHMGEDRPTDVLSFPLDDAGLASPSADVVTADEVPLLLGDVVIAPAVAAAQCTTHAGTYDDELGLLLVHGILHVLGHDHADAGQGATMRRRELELLETLHWCGPAPPGFRQDHA